MKGEVDLSALKSVGMRLAASMAFHTGAINLFDAGDEIGGGFGILLYHRVNPDDDPLFPSTAVTVFDAQMQYLARNFRVLPLISIIERIQQGRRLEPLTIAVTFDDGYRDNYAHAHPVVKKYCLPATVFVATGFTGSDELMWNDRLAWAVRSTKQERLCVSVGGREWVLPLETGKEKMISLNTVLEYLKTCADEQKAELLEHLIAELKVERASPDRLMLNWEELRVMSREGWDIGSHTMSHPILTRIGLSAVAEELQSSKRSIEQELQRPAKLFAYPNGKRTDYNQDIKLAAKDAGYVGAVTTLRGINRCDPDFFELRRWSVWEDHLPTLACKLRYSYGRKMSHGDDY